MFFDPERHDDKEVGHQRAGSPRRSPAKRSRSDAGRHDDRHNTVVNNFYGEVDARGSTFGNGSAVPVDPGGRLRYTTGKLRDVEVLATVSNYVPSPRFDEAAERLCHDRFLVLVGERGSGRRAGIMALLREVVDHRRIVTLSPALTPEDLAEWDYRADHGYLVVDAEGLRHGDELGWDAVIERVRRARAYLVITDTVAPAAVSYLPWDKPPAAEVLRAHLGANWPKEELDALVERLVARLPADPSLRWLATLAKRVNACRDPQRALRDMEEMCGRRVRRWFDQPRTGAELAAVTAAAFLAGATERSYESRLARLEQLLVEHEPVRRGERSVDQDRYDSRRRNPIAAAGELLRSAPAGSSDGGDQLVLFNEPSYERFVVVRVRETAEAWFWNATREWICELIDGPDRLRVASGVAWLACARFDEVAAAFLEPWSRGRRGWSGKVGATYVLWCMCRDETTAPLALRTAIRWAGSGEANQRATAVMAFGGELGVTYPVDAARRLWQLMTQTDDLREPSRTALGRLFAVLVDQTREAGAVLGMLDAQRVRNCAPDGKHRLRDLTIEAILATLTAPSNRTGRPAITELLLAEPDRSDLVAQLWSAAIGHRPTRREAMIALWQCLHGFAAAGRDAAPAARTLGAAMADERDDRDRAQLRADLARLDQELRQDGAVSPTPPFVAFQEALSAGS